jgi:phage host-nuclease inhibitor protein Gam
MTTQRIKPAPITRSKAEQILGELAALTIQRNDAKLCLDAEITTIRTKYEDTISVLGKRIEEQAVLLESWAASNPEEFPKDRKSLEMVHGIIGFRTGTPKLKTIARKTWDAVKDTLQTMWPGFYIRVKEEVNKEAILSDFAQGNITEAQLRSIGVTVVQEESFFVEPKLEPLETRTTKEAA